jgi:hypothetical protein
MTLLSSIASTVIALASKYVDARPASSTIGTLAGMAITAGEVRTGLSVLLAFPIADVSKALAAKLANVQDDAVVLEDVASALGSVGVPGAAYVGAAIKVLAWVAANSLSPADLTPLPPSPGMGRNLPGSGSMYQ